MLVKFWGVRGSTPTPIPGNLKYGGNTACVELRTCGGQLIIFDAGTGIRALGRQLMRAMPEEGHRIMLFLSHYHWDHIQGFPFFEPMYTPKNFVYLHGYESPDASIERALGEQMAQPFFPVSMGVMPATRNFYSIVEETLQIGDARVTARRLNHPQGCMGYRVEDEGGIVVYATDHEHGNRTADENLRLLAEGADILIYDAQYTPDEYPSKRGWGHSTWREAVQLAREIGVRQLVLFHHDPDHSDYFLDCVVEEARREFPHLHAARENMEIHLEQHTRQIYHRNGIEKRYNPRQKLPLRLALRFRDAHSQEQFATAENISLDGAYFLTDHPIEIGRQLDMGLELSGNGKGHAQLMRTSARVVRCERVEGKIGIGVTFR